MSDHDDELSTEGEGKGGEMSTAALELFSPTEIDRYDDVKADLAGVKRHLDALVLSSDESAMSLHDGLSTVMRLVAVIEDTRKAQVGPLNDQVKAYNDTWRPLTVALKAMEVTAKRKLLAWQQAKAQRIAQEQAAARRLQEEAQRREAEALAKVAAAKNSKAREAAMVKVEAAAQQLMDARLAEPMDAPRGIKTDFGTSSTKWMWKHKVTDETLVPRQYLMVDEQAIKRAVAEGARDIAGVAIYEEESLAVRVRA